MACPVRWFESGCVRRFEIRHSQFWEYSFESKHLICEFPIAALILNHIQMNLPKLLTALSEQDHRVYLIEDEDALRMQLVATLREAGLIVQEFSSAEAFLAEPLGAEPALILSDMVLPGLSGLDLLRSVRQRGITSPLIYISGYSEPHQIIDGMKLGAVDFLWKPFKTEALLDVVCKALCSELERDIQRRAQLGLHERWASLTEREQEVCKLMLLSFGNKDIAERLMIQPDTVNKHRMKVLKKMVVKTRPELIDLLKDFAPARL
jgi:FixJ family two-component response regulator